LIPREILVENALPGLDVPRKGPKLERLRKIGGLKCEILEALSSGRIQEKTAASLAELPIDQRQFLFRLISDLGLNANKASEIVSHIFDLSIYRQESVMRLLARPEAQQILNNKQLALTEKAFAFRELVRRWKFPFITQCRQTFDEWVKQISPTENVSLRPAQSFEDESVIIEIRADSRSKAKNILACLHDVESKTTGHAD
ncbi:MAG: hypothetical protein NTY51_07755, partial [Deltaproteobacteria bacterium]|nr:hypothetical protein [Deltaproteobacteria bacterium]